MCDFVELAAMEGLSASLTAQMVIERAGKQNMCLT